VEDASYGAIFPNAQEGTLYSFGGGYEEEAELVEGNGYLLRMTSDEVVTFTDNPIYDVSAPVSEGWNLISGVGSSLSVEDIYVQDVIYPGTVYGLDANYFNADDIDPGRGYWVRATDDGEIALGAGTPSEFSMDLNLDLYPYETSWSLVSLEDGSEVPVSHDGPFGAMFGVEYFSTMLDPGDYIWTIYDTWGDGMCCGAGYELIVDGIVIATGGLSFADSESVSFTVGSSRSYVTSLTTTHLPSDFDLPEGKGDTPFVGRVDFITETINYEVVSSPKMVAISNKLEEANSISFSSEDHSSKLYFGVEIPAQEILSYSLPPTFAQIAFDVRFSGDTKLVQDAGEIELINSSESVTITYDIKIDAGSQHSWVLTSESGEDYILDGSGEITVPSEERFILNKETVVPSTFTLHQNFPNPFNPTTTFSYDLPSEAFVTLSIYDMLGREVAQLVNTNQELGFKSVQWNATDSMGQPVSAGVYLYKIKAGDFVQTRKMVLLK